MKGVLLTRLSSLNEAAMVDVICCDKTGTLTRNELVGERHPSGEAGLRRSGRSRLRRAGQLAGRPGSDRFRHPDDGGQGQGLAARRSTVTRFTPFDPATKMAEAIAVDAGREIRVVKGAPAVVATVAPMTPAAEKDAGRAHRGWISNDRRRRRAERGAGADRVHRVQRSAARRFGGVADRSCVRSACARSWSPATRPPPRRPSRTRSGSRGRFVRRARFPSAPGRRTSPSTPAFFRSRSSRWSRRSSSRAMRSACAATAPMTRRRCARRKWASPSRPRPTSRKRRPASC